MKKEKNFYIIVTDYPYGNGEPFFEDELVELSKKFEKLFLINTYSEDFIEPSAKYALPENVNVLLYRPDNSFMSKLHLFFSALFMKETWEEIKIVRKQYKLQLSISLIRVIFSYLINGIQFRNYFETIINKNNTHKATNFFYTYWCTYHTLGLAFLKKIHPQIKAVTRVHGWDLYMNRHTPPYLPFRSLIYSTLDKTYTVSNDGKSLISETIPNIPDGKIKVNYLGTTINQSPTKKTSRKKFKILSIAFISEIKRIDLLIESLAIITDFEFEWQHIGGGGEYATQLESIATKTLSQKKNATIKFYGHLTKDQIYEVLRKEDFDVFINTSSSEGLPVSIMEAMSFGIPAIATNVGGNHEIVTNNRNGFLISSNPTLEEISNSIRNLYLMPFDDYYQLAINAYNTWEDKFDSNKNTQLFSSEILSLDHEHHKICKRCILDNIDYPEIIFDTNGICDMCITYDQIAAKQLFPKAIRDQKLASLVKLIKEAGKGKEYDCIIGLSGGVDSSYLAYKAKEYGLKPLIVHLDNNWNSELAVKNIERILKKLEFDLKTHVINWPEFRDLQLSYLKASVVDIEALTDHAIDAILFTTAAKLGIKYILSGENIVTEGRIPPSWIHLKNDLINLKDIHSKFGKIPIKTFPTMGFIETLYYQKVKKIVKVYPLDLIDYNKQDAKKTIIEELEWRDYGGKHYESVFTRFYQSYILPEKFHIDKRKSHYSTLVCSGQMSRDEALKLMLLPAYDDEKIKDDKEYVLKKFGLTEAEFDQIMQQPIKKHTDYKSITVYIDFLLKIKRLIFK